MCDFLSGIVTLSGDVHIRSTTSHAETVRVLGLKPGTYREWEWTGEHEDRLIVRTEPGDRHGANWYRACVLALGETRTAMLARLLREDVAWQKWLAAGGSLRLNGLTNADNVTFPETIGGSLGLNGLANADNVTFPETIGGDLWLDGLTNADNVTFPETIGGSLGLDGLANADNVTFPETIGGSLGLDGLANADNVTFPETIGGSLWLNGLTNADNVTFPETIGGSLGLAGMMD